MGYWRRPQLSEKRSSPRTDCQAHRNTLVLVHRRELLTQWVERLHISQHRSKVKSALSVVVRRKPTGIIDVAVIQSLVRKGEVPDMVGDYGHIVVDECHHLSAASFEAIARAAKARFVLGLSATVARKDGHHPIIFMQCGPVRHRVDARRQAAAQPFSHKVVHRRTDLHSSHNQPVPSAFSDPGPLSRIGE